MSKILIGTDLGSYTFDSAAKTITFSGFTPRLDRFLIITDVTNNTIIYNFADANKGGAVSGQVLTLDFDTTVAGFANTDLLQVWYYDENYLANAMLDIAMSIKRDLALQRRDDRFSVGTGLPVILPTNQTISTIFTVNNLSALGVGGEFYSPFIPQLQMRANSIANIAKNIS
jgi:hypothetical protein